MGVRGEIYSTKVALDNRTYFFNVKENRLGDLYLNIVESKNKESGGFDRQSIVLFSEDLQNFLKGFDDALKVMEKTARQKRKSISPHETAAAKKSYREPASKDGERGAERDAAKNGRRAVYRDRRSSASFSAKDKTTKGVIPTSGAKISGKRVVRAIKRQLSDKNSDE